MSIYENSCLHKSNISVISLLYVIFWHLFNQYIQAKINGRPGIVVSGGSGRGNKNMTSVEFFDSRSGEWLSLPSLNRGRRSHVMTVTKGKLLVAGGEGVGRSGKEYLDDMEIFNGRRWVPTNQKLDRPRSNFSLGKVYNFDDWFKEFIHFS